MRALLLAFCAPLLGGCPTDPGGSMRSPDGAGYCCPIEPATCDCFHNGGFASSLADCDFLTLCDAGLPIGLRTDEHGCQQVVSSTSCLARDGGGGSDAGP